MKKWMIISILIVVVAGVSVWFLLGKDKQSQNVMATAQTANVEKGKLEVAVSGAGSVTAITDQDVTVENTSLIIDSVSVTADESVYKGETLVTFSNGVVVTAPHDGKITEVNVENGDGASRGTILFRIEDEGGDITPITRGDNYGSDSVNDGSNLTVDTVSVKEGDTVKAGATLLSFTDGSILQAPVSGTVTSLSVASGDSTPLSEPVAHITNYNLLQTTISVDELDITKVEDGQAVAIIANAFEDKTFEGEVTKVANEGTAANGVSMFDVTIKISDPENLKIGMSTEANITIESKEDALYVPIEAVYKSRDEKYVLVSTNSNDTKQVTVETGISNDIFVEITSGLKEGDTVQIPIVQSQSGGGSLEGGMMMPGGDFPGGFPGNGDFSSGGFEGRNGGGSPFGGGAPSGE